MTIVWNSLLQWSPTPLLEAYDEMAQAQQIFEETEDALAHASGRFSSWGAAAESARYSLGYVVEDANHVEAQFTHMMIALRQAADSVREIQQEVDDIKAYAEHSGVSISSTGNCGIEQWVWDEAQAQAQAQREFYLHPEQGLNDQLEESLKGTPAYLDAAFAMTETERRIAAVIEWAITVDETLTGEFNTVSNGEASFEARYSADNNNPAVSFIALSPGAMPPNKVRALWDALSEKEQEDLIKQHPQFFGSLPGIPASVRSRINDHLANLEVNRLQVIINKHREDLESGNSIDPTSLEQDIRQLEQRRDYYQSVIDDPDRSFYKFDAQNRNIIEMHGTLSDETDVIYTHINGTASSIDGLANGSATEVPRGLRETAESEGLDVVTFTYVQTDSHVNRGTIEWGLGASPRSNINTEHLDHLGKGLAEHVDGLEEEDSFRGATNVASGHSAGHSVIGASENNGAHYDQVFSLAGSFLPGGWQPNHSTNYDHIHYRGEPIHFVPTGPHLKNIYEKHPLTNDGRGPVATHERVNSGLDQNREGIFKIVDELQG